MAKIKRCNYCSEPATLKDNIYGPTTVWTCGASECLNQAQSELWECSHEEVTEDDHEYEGSEENDEDY